jgi:hypothetical protein
MKDRIILISKLALAAASLAAAVAPSSAFAQSAPPPAGVVAVEKAAAALAPKGWVAPKAPDGHPDLQGYYTNVSTTPVERPKTMADKAFWPSKDDADSYSKQLKAARSQDRRDGDPSADVSRSYNELFIDSGTEVAITMQTSLVVDPPDGRIPAQTAEVMKQAAAEQADMKAKCADPTRVCPPGYDGKTPGLADKASDFSLMTRCIKWGTVGPPMMPSIYDSNYHIIQTKNYVMIQVEGGRDVRLIPIDGSPHVPDNVRLWLGDSRGHWEGNTLVVDTTNFSDETNFRRAGRNLHVVERFTRVAPNVILYEFTVHDPTTFTGDWTAAIPMTTIKGPIFEYACNEGNYGMADMLRGARVYEQQKAEAMKNGGAAAKPAADGGGQQ